MKTRLYSRYRRKHDGFTVEVLQSQSCFIVLVPPTGNHGRWHEAMFDDARPAATFACKSAQAGRAAWQTK